MPQLNQPQLQRRIEIFIANGQIEPAQNIMAGIGYNPAALENSRLLLQTWLRHKTKAQALLAAQKQATAIEEQARRTAQTHLSDLVQTIRVLFGHDPAVLTSLGLLARRSNGHTNAVEADGSATEPGHARSQGSTSLAKIIARWRLLLANLQTLSEAQQNLLTQAGWNAERIAAAGELVEACAVANTSQKQKVQAYRAEARAAQQAETALRQWYSQAARLSKIAIKRSDPANLEQLHGLLGL